MLEARDIRLGLGGTTILHGISLEVAPGEVVAVLGPNGAGKSTMIGVLSGALAPDSGQAALDGRRLALWKPRDLARRRAVLPQHSELGFSFRVLEVVLIGRSPHMGFTSQERDLSVAVAALAETGAVHLADRVFSTLSGGERQRVQLARILAQADFADTAGDIATRYLLLDEPTANLDLAHQHATLETARRAAGRGMGVVAVLHDINQAAMYADRIAILKDGYLSAQGAPDDILTEAVVRHAFDLPVMVGRHPTRGCPNVIAI